MSHTGDGTRLKTGEAERLVANAQHLGSLENRRILVDQK